MIVVCDIDGTIADATHRLHWIETQPKNWNAFFAGVGLDKPIQPMIELVNALADAGHVIFFVSGRPEKTRGDTEKWLHERGMGWPQALYLRPDGDFRQDDIVKQEILDKLVAQNMRPDLVLDDRPRVLRMWRHNKIFTLNAQQGEREF